MSQHDMDFGRVQVMEFPWHLLRKWWDFPCRFGLIPEPNQTTRKKTWENPCHIFYRDLIVSHPQSIFSFPFHVICQRIDTTCLGWVRIFQVRSSFVIRVRHYWSESVSKMFMFIYFGDFIWDQESGCISWSGFGCSMLDEKMVRCALDIGHWNDWTGIYSNVSSFEGKGKELEIDDDRWEF